MELFYGRDMELEGLNSLYNKEGFRFAIVYGRRRVGKSALIKHFIDTDNKLSISYVSIERNDKQNLDSFSKAIFEAFGFSDSFSAFSSWENAFDFIIENAKDKRLILFIDEYPYLANSNKSLTSLLQKYIDTKFINTNIMLILCGSSMSFMENQVLGAKSPLYGRRDMQFKLEPFDYYDSARFFEETSSYEKAIAYGVSGGVAQYLKGLSEYDSINDGIKNCFLIKYGALYEEPRNLLLQELREPAVYNTIIYSIAKGASRLNDISLKVGQEGTKVFKYLSNLIDLRLVKKELPIVGGQERKGIYSLADNMFRFWYRFVLENWNNIELGLSDHVFKSKILPQMSDFMGRVFEDICIQYIKRQNALMRLPVVIDKVGRWWGNNTIEKRQEEMDVVGVANDSIVLGECKWKKNVDTDVFDELKRKRNQLFSNYKKAYYYIFAIDDFSPELIKLAKSEKNLTLVTLDEVYDL